MDREQKLRWYWNSWNCISILDPRFGVIAELRIPEAKVKEWCPAGPNANHMFESNTMAIEVCEMRLKELAERAVRAVEIGDIEDLSRDKLHLTGALWKLKEKKARAEKKICEQAAEIRKLTKERDEAIRAVEKTIPGVVGEIGKKIIRDVVFDALAEILEQANAKAAADSKNFEEVKAAAHSLIRSITSGEPTAAQWGALNKLALLVN